MTSPRMQAAQLISHTGQKTPDNPGSSASRNPRAPQTNSPVTTRVFHFLSIVCLSLHVSAQTFPCPTEACSHAISPGLPGTSPKSMK